MPPSGTCRPGRIAPPAPPPLCYATAPYLIDYRNAWLLLFVVVALLLLVDVDTGVGSMAFAALCPRRTNANINNRVFKYEVIDILV